MDPLKTERQGFNAKFEEKRKEMEPLQQALGKLRGNDGGTGRGPAICSSEEELNNMVNNNLCVHSFTHETFFYFTFLSFGWGFVGENVDIQLPISDSTREHSVNRGEAASQRD